MPAKARVSAGANKGLGSPRSRRGLDSNRSSSLSCSNVLSGDDKRDKYREQTRSRMKKLLGLGLVLVVVISVVSKASNKSDEPSESGGGDSGSGGNVQRSRDYIAGIFLRATPPPTSSPTLSTPPPSPPPSPPPTTNQPTPPPTNKPTTAPPTNKPTPEPVQPLQTVTIEKGSSTSICGHPIPLDLSDHAKWPTPYTPILKGSKTPELKKDSKQITLLKNDKPKADAGLGAQLNSLFHAFDYSVETGHPLYITEDSWALTTLFQLFFGNIPPANRQETHIEFLSTIQETLGVTVIENEDVLKAKKLEVPKATPPEWLYGSIAKDFTNEQIRDHRNTILRGLFMHPLLDVCTGLIDTVLGADRKNKIVVIHVAAGSRELLPKFNKSYGKDQSAAVEMTPDYIKTILKQIGADNDHDIYLIDGDGDGGDTTVHDQFAKDPELKGKVKAIKAGLGEKIYLATLAEAFIGNPVSQMGLWIARFRMALGMGKNTFVLTEKKGDKWESLLSEENYLDLYDKTKLRGPWMA